MSVATLARATKAAPPIITCKKAQWEKKNAPPSLEEVKKAVNELLGTVQELKKTNDQRFDAIEKKGHAPAELEAKIAKLNESIEKNEKIHNDFIAAAKKREEEAKAALAELEKKWEARFNREDLGAGGDEAAEKKKRQLETKAYDKYLRKGRNADFTEDERKVLIVGNDATGGYLAPPEMVMDIIKGVVEFTPFRSICTVYQTSRGELLLPKRTQVASATRVGEVQQRNETQNPAWGMLSIQTPEMYAQARISKQNLEDSAFNLAQFITDEFREQFGVKEGAEAINGTGHPTQLLGILAANAAGLGTPLSFQVSGSAATIAGPAGAQADGLIDLFYGVKTAYAARGRWILNRNSLGQVRKLKDTQGQYLWAPPIAVGEPATILGAPYTECPDMPNQGANAFPIGFGDWKRAYVIVDRVEIDIVRDDLTLADNGQVKFTGRRRVGGQVVLGEAVKLLKCST